MSHVSQDFPAREHQVSLGRDENNIEKLTNYLDLSGKSVSAVSPHRYCMGPR